MEDFIMIDGVNIPRATPAEEQAFVDWLKANKVKEPYHPNQHYDYVSAFRNGVNRDGKSAHFPDTYKLPKHPTFSIESQYYRHWMPAGYWEGERYVPIKTVYDLPPILLNEVINRK